MSILLQIIPYIIMNLPIAIIDSRAPKSAIKRLAHDFEVFEFYVPNITYEAISGHPDVFLFQYDNSFIVAPNAPRNLINFLMDKEIPFVFGDSNVGDELQNSTQYNCVQTSTHFFHKQGFTDAVVLHNSFDKQFVSLPQAYTRCSMFSFDNQSFITSDKGVERELLDYGFSCLYCNPDSILLPPYIHGFIGGCLGKFADTLYVIGNLRFLSNEEKIREFIASKQFTIVELYDGPLYDGGGIFFLKG